MNDMTDEETATKIIKKYGGQDGDLIALAHSITRWLGWNFDRALTALENVKTKSKISEGIENLFGPPASQAFADTGNNPHIDNTKLGKPFDEKSDTGDDKTRTGPGGLLPRDSYDGIHYQGEKDSKIHLATPYFDGKEPHDVSGTIPELQEDIKITIEDPLGDENIPTIELLIKEPELELKKIEEEPQLELKNYPGRKDPDTHIFLLF